MPRSVARALVAAEADGLKGHGLSRLPIYAAQAKVGKVDGFATPAIDAAAPGTRRGRRGERLCLSGAGGGGGRCCPELAPQPGVAAGGDPALASLRRGRPSGRAAGRGGARRADVRQYAGRRSRPGAARSRCSAPIRSPSRVRCPDARRSWSTSRSPRWRAATSCPQSREASAFPKAGRSTQRASRPPIPMPRCAAPCCRWATPRARRSPSWSSCWPAGLTGANFAAEASSFLDAEGPPPGTGQLIIAFDPGAVGADAVMRFGVLAASIEEQPGARLPGARRLCARAKKAKAEGLVVSDALMKEIEAA